MSSTNTLTVDVNTFEAKCKQYENHEDIILALNVMQFYQMRLSKRNDNESQCAVNRANDIIKALNEKMTKIVEKKMNYKKNHHIKH